MVTPAPRDGGAAPPPDATQQPRERVFGLALPSLASQIWFVGLPPLLTLIADDLGATPAHLGQAHGLSMLVAAALALGVGPLASMFSLRAVMLLGLAALAVSSFMTALASAVELFLVARLAGSFGRASVIPAVIAEAVRSERSGARRTAVSLAVVGASAAPLIGLPLVTTVAAFFGWRAAIVVVGSLALVSLLLAWRLLPPGFGQGSAGSSALTGYRALLSDPSAISVLSSTLLGNAAIWTCFTYVGVLYAEGLQLPSVAAGWALTVVGVGLVIGSGAAAHARVGVASRRLLGGSRAASGLLLGIPFMLTPDSRLIEAMFGVAGIILGTLTVITPLILREESRISAGTLQSLNWFALTLGVALGSSLGGLLLTAGGLVTVGWGAVGVSALSALVLLWPLAAPPHLRRESGPITRE